MGLIGRIYVGDHLTLLHTKYVSCGPHGFREDFLSFSHYMSMGVQDPLGHGQFTQGLDWQDLCRGLLNIATYKTYKLWASWFQRRFFKVFPIISLWELYIGMAAILINGP